ncbi:MAG: tyrosine decarboxylase MfnA [Desulfurococcales archaeon]|nr:tyrosine decarboxylase MfnA [Desulfurococcales archaeon]
MRPEDVLRALKEFREMEPSYVRGEVLGSMTTEPPWFAVEAFKIFINTNLNDTELFSGTYSLERDCVRELSRLFGGVGFGFLTYGGTESNITALYILRELRGGSVVVAPKTAHSSIRKACRILRLKLIEVGVGEDFNPLLKDMCELVRRYGDEVTAVVMTAGTTDVGNVDPVDEFCDVCKDAEVPIHVDAAYGGLVAPFLRKHGYRIPQFDFSLRNVYTITVDLHKLIAPIPCSALLLRSRELEELATFESPYMPLGKQRTLLGTRTGGIAASAWAVLKVLGFEGIEKLALELMERTRYLVEKLRELNLSVVKEPVLPLVAFEVPRRERVIEELWRRRLFVYPSAIPNVVRVVVGSHITYEHINRFVGALSQVISSVK